MAEVSELIAVSEAAIYEGLCETHEMKRIRLKSKGKGRPVIRFYLSDVTAWMNKRIQAAQPEAPRQKHTKATDRVIELAAFKRSRER